MARFPASSVLYTVLLASLLPRAAPQTISTSTPVPPLQWINLSSRLQGSDNAPPPLKDAAIGYDETTRNIIIFGGESENGFPQSTTYLLNLDSLTWSKPSPPDNLNDSPDARSAAITGYDAASSYRSGFVVIGGKSRDGQGLSDVWEFDFNNQFWAQVSVSEGGPSGRWGASGGIDSRTASDSLNNTFYVAGGYDGSQISRLSDVWELHISGVLSPNLPNEVAGSWSQVSVDDLPRKIGQAGTVIGQTIVAAGGCNSTSTDGDSCAVGDSYVISTSDGQVISPGACPAGRRGASLVPNMNSYSNSFSSQVFYILGTFDSSRWDDGGGLDKGEVSVLDTNTGTWARVIPSGDPDSDDATPTPREGAAAITYTRGLVGSHRSQSVDTIVFGGRDASGKYLNEVWLLRAYDGSISSSGSWSGGSGDLESGADASGAGVTVNYMDKCASALTATSSGTSTSAGPSATHGPSPTQSSAPSAGVAPYPYNTSANHKVLSAVSVVLLYPAALIFRLSSSSFTAFAQPARHVLGVYSAMLLALAAYALGIAGLATSFTSLTSTSSSATLSRRDSPVRTHLDTAHGRAGLVLFILLYAVLPVLLLVRLGSRKFRNRSESPGSESGQQEPKGSALEMKGSPSTPPQPRARSPTQSLTSSTEPRPRTMSLPLSGPTAASTESSGEGGKRSFEVLNRGRGPSRPATSMSYSSPHVLSRSLGELDWLQRRRSLNTVGELDYAITQVLRQHTQPATPNTTDALMGPSQEVVSQPSIPEYPAPGEIATRVLFHAALLAVSALCLVALYLRAPVWSFAVFLVWVVGFYAAMLVLAWRGTPLRSTLTAVVYRLRGKPIPPRDTSTIASAPIGESGQYPFPTNVGSVAGRSPYVHTPMAYRATNDDGTSSHPLSADGHYDDDEDEDEDVQQRRMEEELDRRDVSIVTVPKRRLWVANPS
ncbi:hypothetical protein EV121DRAFT_263075 [Schizophyllum commune]